ncbi:unnamed protein product [Ilex paraguariensis]|uniref:Uncharacterized protein n=1 Tax=Ilex paraguariensis TaxID=185542 RepID=A0ABC8UVA7_9AQUA
MDKLRVETEKEYGSKFDNAQSYVSRLLQVSSVFDDEEQNPPVFDENKLQTWSSQYYRVEPVVVVAPQSSVLEERSEKPLILPVRSLNTCVSDSDMIESDNVSDGKFGGASPLDLEERVEENVILRSPIPWRSRSGRMEMKEDGDSTSLYQSSLSSKSHSFRSQSSRSSRPNSNSPSPNKFSPTPSLSSPKNRSPSPSSSRIEAKNAEDLVRKKFYHKSSPPPPSYRQKTPLMKSNSSLTSADVSSKKELKRSVRSLPMDLNKNSIEEVLSRANMGSESRPRTQNGGPRVAKSVRTIRSTVREFGENFMNEKAEKRSEELESIFIDKREKLLHERVPLVSQQIFSDFPEREERKIDENVVVETGDDEWESEDINIEGCPESEEVAENRVGDNGPDVDRKADEFIAKFREQIRLQRIESIRRSTGPSKKNLS